MIRWGCEIRYLKNCGNKSTWYNFLWSMVLNGTCDPDQMNGRTEKRRKERRNEAKKEWRSKEMKEWRNELMKEPMMEGKEPHHLIRTTTCYFFNRPCKDSFISTWLTLSASTVGKIWHILSLGQISIEVPLFKVSLLGSLCFFQS